ncbi:MAG TPA: kelch repeat-containing protein, partial [Kofleriaceae bacterium]
RHQTIKFGGNTATTASWNGTTWTTLATPTSPSARSDAAMTYDRDRQRTVMFGGADSSTGDALGDTWEWDGASWHELHPAHVPPPRVYAQLAYDPIAKQSVLAGGGGGLSALQDTWTWDGTDWTEVVADAAHTPPGASGAAALWVPRRQSFVSFSGSIITSSASTASTWEWKRGQWNPIEIAGIPPTPRGNAVTLLARDGSLLTWSGVRLLGGDLSAFELGWENASTPEACVAPMDLDGDGLAGCDDPDCYYVCNPTCLPGTTCDATQPHCGDGTCSDLENCRMCPGDCGACPAMCGDTFCDPGETAASCPGDCS